MRIFKKACSTLIFACLMFFAANPAAAWDFCFRGCDSLIVKSHRSSGNGSDSNDDFDKNYANKALQKYNEFKLTEGKPLGYSWVEFSFLDNDGKAVHPLQNNAIGAQSIVDRSLIDWIKNLFRSSRDSVLVSLDVYDSSGGLIASKPLYAATYSDEFHAVTSSNDIELLGKVGFPRQSNTEQIIKLNIRYAESDVVSLDKLTTIIESAAKLTNLLPGGAVGWLDEVTLASYKSAASSLDNLLGEFTSTTTLSTTVPFVYKKDNIVGFKYYFKASGESLLSSVALWVKLKYAESILDYEGRSEPNQILNVQVHLKDKSSTDLLTYIESADLTRDLIDLALGGGNFDMLQLCGSIRDVLSRRFNKRDTALALSAYFQRRWYRLKDKYDRACFYQDEAKIIEVAGVAMPEPPEEKVEPTPLTFTQQERVIKLLSKAAANDISAELESATELFELRTNADEEQFILVNDNAGFLYPNPRTVQLKARDLYGDIARVTKKLDRGLGCYSGDFLDTKDQPNAFGSLSLLDGRPIEILVEFYPQQQDAERPRLQRISFSYPTKARLVRYRDGTATRATKGCAGSFFPWDIDYESEDT